MTELPSREQLLVRKLTRIVEANLEREDFDVVQLAKQAGMSRSVIHRRLKSLGMRNTSHCIREIRLHKAREMLHAGFETAAEVAYRVGFGSPTYFSKCFHEYFGYPPGEERKRAVTDASDDPGGQVPDGRRRKSLWRIFITLSLIAIALTFTLAIIVASM